MIQHVQLLFTKVKEWALQSIDPKDIIKILFGNKSILFC